MALGRKTSGALSLISLALIAVGFVATVTLANNALKSARLDLTEEGLFTLSEGTLNVINKIDEPITLRYYFSGRLAREIPQIGILGERVKDMLEEFAAYGQGKIRLEIIDPLPFTDEEDRAVAVGLQGVPVDQTGETVYFGLFGVNATDHQQVIPFFDEKREPFLEYDLARIVYNLANPNKPKVGLITTVPVAGSQRARGAPSGPDDSWVVWSQAKQFFDMSEVSANSGALPDDLDLLLIIQPPTLSDEALYGIDQFLLNGGKVIAFVDPHSEADAQRPPQRGGQQRVDYGTADKLQKLFHAWGMEVPAGKLVGDISNARKVRAPNASKTRMLAIEYPLWMALRRANMSETDITTSQLDQLHIASPGHIVPYGESGGLTIEPLIQTSQNAGLVDVGRAQGRQPDIVGIANDLKAEAKFTIAARLTGIANTAFPDGPPRPAILDEAEAKDEDKTKAQEKFDAMKAKHKAKSDAPVGLAVTADVDLLADGLWVQVQDLFGQRIAVPNANNGAFFANLLENLTGSADLIGLRSRGGFQRPFTLINEIQRDAERQFRAKEQELLQDLEAVQKKLTNVKRASDPSGKTSLVLTDAQRAEIDAAQQQMLKVRKELRDVQFALRSDVETLTGKIKAANVVLMPLIIAILALFGAFLRSQHRRAFQREFAKAAKSSATSSSLSSQGSAA